MSPPIPHFIPSASSSARPSPSDSITARQEEVALARRLLAAEAEAVAALSNVIGPDFFKAVDLIVRCADARGNVLVSGLGKSGLIGQKISATLASLAITSHFVHPAEAAHGDLGRFRSQDLCIALSYSGETDEVVALASILRQDGLPIISITKGRTRPESNSQLSSLDRLATVGLPIGDCDKAEISPAPTCSTTAMLALGDALALCAAHRRNFTTDDFAKRHPGGSLGGLLRPVCDILRFKIGVNLEAFPDALTIAEVLRQADAGNSRRPGALLLIDERTQRLSGIFTDADLRRLVIRSTSDLGPGVLDRPVKEFMTRSPTTLTSDALVRDAVVLVRENRRDEIPVVDALGRPVGILDVQDLIAMRLIKD